MNIQICFKNEGIFSPRNDYSYQYKCFNILEMLKYFSDFLQQLRYKEV